MCLEDAPQRFVAVGSAGPAGAGPSGRTGSGACNRRSETGRNARSIRFVVVETIAYSIACSSSRTLPGHCVLEQQRERAVRDALELFFASREVAWPVFLDEVLDEQRNVLAALAQRRNVDRHDGQAVVQVLAESFPSCTSCRRSRLVAAITRTSTWRVRVSPTRSNVRSWSTRSSLAWSAGGRVADLVEEDRAARGRLEAPGLVAGPRP